MPYWFSKQGDTWIDCNEGKVRVRWLGNRWVVLATNQRSEYPDERDLRGVVAELVVKLGGLER